MKEKTEKKSGKYTFSGVNLLTGTGKMAENQ